MTGIVQQAGDRNNVLVDLGKVEALLPRSEQVDGERYEQGSRIKAVITEVRTGTKGPQVILSRRDPELIKTLFELEVPEIADGLVEIRGVAREPGYRSKIAVESHAQGVDPVGACVGPRGSRVRMVVSELRGEKIDIIPWNPEPARFVAKALSPARVREVYLDDEAKEATVVVPDDQLALAIGKEGMNARLAHRLTGWKIDIVSDTEFAQQEAEAAYGGGEPGDERRHLRPLRGDPLERQALPERVAARLEVLRRPGAPGARDQRAVDDEEPNRVVDEPEPELEALADEPPVRSGVGRRRGARRARARTRSSRPGRGDAPVERPRRDARVRRRAGRCASRTTRTTACRSRSRRRRERPERGRATTDELTRSGPARAAAARRRRASSSASTRWTGRSRPARAPAAGVYTCRRLACFERASARRAFNRTLRQTVVVDPDLARLYT